MITKSKNFKDEYCCTVVEIKTLESIEGSDFLAKTLVNGEPIVVRKDQVQPGDVMFYASNESQLAERFLTVNNLYEDYELNANRAEVEALKAEGKEEEAKCKHGFFNKHGRVRAIRLRKQLSMGYLFLSNELLKAYPEAYRDIENLKVGDTFDEINGEIFIKAYVPPRSIPAVANNARAKFRNRKIRRFDRMVEGEFSFHYDTAQLPKHIQKINPDDIVTASVKVHGTSAIFANIKIKKQLPLPFYKKWYNKVIDYFNIDEKFRVIDYYIDYGDVFSSRSVIKNQYINQGVTSGGYYSVDVWGWWNEKLKHLIPKGWTVYGEIAGYLPGSQQLIQKGYDYGCEEGQSCFMPYRISIHDPETDEIKELNVADVFKWSLELREHFKEEKECFILPLQVLYHGPFDGIYPELNSIEDEEEWYNKVLEHLRNDKERFGMELSEPLCNKKTPREGFCLRIDDDPILECFKLKCEAFMKKERAAIDAGEADIEMQQA